MTDMLRKKADRRPAQGKAAEKRIEAADPKREDAPTLHTSRNVGNISA